MDGRLERLLAGAAELERRDTEVAGSSARLAELASRVGALRERAVAVSAALGAIPGELAANEESRATATATEHDAALDLAVAEERVALLERSRRRRDDDLDQARRELGRARDDLADARARSRRLAERRERLLDQEGVLRAEADGLTVDAGTLAVALTETPRLPALGGPDADSGLAGIEVWGGRVRGALLVARNGLDTERERLVAEANTLVASVLGEQGGASSVTLVRRRLEQELGPR